MRATKFIFGVIAALSIAATQANEMTIVNNVLGPEGPVYVEGNL